MSLNTVKRMNRKFGISTRAYYSLSQSFERLNISMMCRLISELKYFIGFILFGASHLFWLEDVQAIPTVELICERAVSADMIEQPTLQIAIISELRGYVEPCGCTIDLKLGSIERLAAQVKQLRSRAPTLVLSVGSLLFEHDTLKEHAQAQEKAKASLIRRIWSHLHVDAHLPGRDDLAAGVQFSEQLRRDHPLTEVGLNPSALSSQGSAQLFDVGGTRVGVIGLLPSEKMDEEDQLSELIKEATTDLKGRGATLVIALASIDRALTRRLAERHPEVELWALGYQANEESSLSPVNSGGTDSSGSYIIEAGDRGRHLAILSVYHPERAEPLMDPEGERAREIKALELKIKMRSRFAMGGSNPLIARQLETLNAELSKLKQGASTFRGKRVLYQLKPIQADLSVDQEIEGWVKRYQASLKELNMSQASQVKPPPPNGNGYAGQAECELCHEAAVQFWRTTRHSHAWQTLEKSDKTFDVECVSCHVTGWQEAGGSALGHTDRLQNVQCEACHGPASKHAEMGGGEAYVKRAVPSSQCERCHNQLHSPRFDYATYRQKVIGPGHGAPLPENQE